MKRQAIRKYMVITNKNECFKVEAETPQKALEEIYKNYYIKIEISDKERATHMVELLESNRNSKKYYLVHVYKEGLDRKKKPDNYIEPMPKKQLQKLIKDFKAKGGIIVMSEESERYLKSKKAEGIALNATTILLSKNPSRSAVYEELIHAEQYRQGKIDGSYKNRLLCEIEAQEILIKRKREYGITDIEDKQTRIALKTYKKLYADIKNIKQ